MKKIYKLSVLLLVFVLIASSCSRKKSTFMTRNYRAVVTEYNTLYNGGMALDQGNVALAQNYNDDFFEILHVERLQLPEDIQLPGQENNNSDFGRAEEKAVKAIQKHSIFINGKEHNPQIDEAYMLLGKSRYFEGRFIPAIEAFNFILHRYPTSNNVNAAKIWREKTNIRLNNEELAIKNLKELLEKEDINDEDFADASAILVQAYIQMDALDSTLVHIKNASEYTKNNELKGRYLYIKGQLYNRLQIKDSANLAFDEVIALNRKSPRAYMINAQMEKAKNFNYEETQDGEAFTLCEHLTELSEDRENRPFLDIIHHQLGMHYLNIGDKNNSVVHLNKSIKLFTQNKKLQALNYLTLGDMSFDEAQYRRAGQYYDSTLTHLPEISREYRQIKKKRDNLKDVIYYEDIAQVNDSILMLVNMTEAERLAYFTAHTEKLKAKAIADSIAKAERQDVQYASNEFFKEKGQEDTDGKFYFYNTTAVSFGKQDFKRQWGDRRLEDDWRRSNKNTSSGQALNNTIATHKASDGNSILNNDIFKPESYLSQIPTEPKIIDSIKTDRDMAYYQLGLIYKEKFKEYQLGADRLEKLLTFQPEERLIVPAKYHLYKIYGILGKTADEQKYRNDIVTNHPDSRYAEIINNPEAILATDQSSPEFKYYELYHMFEQQQYAEVIDKADLYILQFTGEDIVPKFELLKATAIGKQDGFNAYKKALNYVSLNYPNSEEGKRAQEIYNTTLKQLEHFNFQLNEDSKRWKLVYEFDTTNKEEAVKLKEKVDKAIEELKYTTLSTSSDYYTPGKMLVVVHGLYSREGAQGFAEVIKIHKDYKVVKPSFEISSENYAIVQVHKNLDLYNAKTQ